MFQDFVYLNNHRSPFIRIFKLLGPGPGPGVTTPATPPLAGPAYLSEHYSSATKKHSSIEVHTDIISRRGHGSSKRSKVTSPSSSHH